MWGRILVGLLIIFCSGSFLYAGSQGEIDWITRTVRAKGIEVPEDGVINATLAKGRAVLDARKKLVEVIKTVPVNDSTTMKDYMLSDEGIFEKVLNLLNTAKKSDKGFGKDGSYSVEMSIPIESLQKVVWKIQKSGIPPKPPKKVKKVKIEEPIVSSPKPVIPASVKEPVKEIKPVELENNISDADKAKEKIVDVPEKVETPETQEGSDNNSSLNSVAVPEVPVGGLAAIGSALAANVNASSSAPPSVKTENKNYSGLVVDLKKLNCKSAMSPKLLSEDGSEVYGTMNIDYEFALINGIVAYTKSVPDAKKQIDRVGKNPLIIKGIKIIGNFKSDGVLSKKDAETAKRILNKNTSIREKCKVIFVID